MRELGPAEGFLQPEQIIELYGDALNELIQATQEPQYEMERLTLINQARRNWHFVKGNHYLVPDLVSTPYGDMSDYTVYGGGSGDSDNGANVRPCYPVPLVGGDCYKFMAVMGQSAPRVKAIADDPNDPQNIDDSRNADANVRDLWVKVRADQKQKTMAFHQYTTGPSYWRAVWTVDRRKYGETTEPNIEIQERVAPDGSIETVPVESGNPKVYPNGDAELHHFTVLEVSHSFMASEVDECHWWKCETMRPKWELLAAYPDRLEKYRTQDPPDDGAAASSNTAQEARESVSSPSGYGQQRRQNQWRHTEYWFDPVMYEAVTEKEAREILKRQYPDGLYLVCVGSVKVKLREGNHAEEWSVCKTGVGEGKILDPAICTDIIPLQRLFNDLFGLGAETILRAIAQTIVDSQLIDREAMAKKNPVPAEIILTAMPVDGDIQKKIGQIPPAHMSDQLVPFATLVRTNWQDRTGIRPELTGGGDPAPTFRQEKQRRDQAMMQLSPQAHEQLYCWERIARNLVKMRAKFGAGTIKVPRRGAFGTETDVVDLARLSEGGWHTEADPNFPMSASDRFDRLYGILHEFPPEVQQALSLLDPINLEQVLELLQIPGFNSAMEDQKRKTLADIAQLLEGQPMEGQPGPNGEPGQRMPSIPADQYDDHAFAARFIPIWMISNTGRAAKDGNPIGFENVVLFWQEHQSMAQPPAPVEPVEPPEPPVKISMSLKPQDIGAEATSQLLQSAGLPGLPPGTQLPAPGPESGSPDEPAPPTEDGLTPPEMEGMPLPLPELAQPAMLQ